MNKSLSQPEVQWLIRTLRGIDFLRWLKDNPDLEKEIRPIAERRKYENILFGGRK